METYRDYGYLNRAKEPDTGTGRNRRTQTRRRRNSSGSGGFLRVLLIYILPFIAINAIIFFIVTSQPDFSVSIEDNGDYKTASLEIKIKTVYPTKEFTVTLDSQPVEITESGKRTYTATLSANGTLEISLTNLNGMNKTVYETVNCLDDEPPIVTEGDAASGYVSMYADDTQSGVDFDSIYAIDGDGGRITPDPDITDEGEGLVVFNYATPPLEVHVFDLAGNECIATFAVTELTAEEAAARDAAESASGEADISISMENDAEE